MLLLWCYYRFFFSPKCLYLWKDVHVQKPPPPPSVPFCPDMSLICAHCSSSRGFASSCGTNNPCCRATLLFSWNMNTTPKALFIFPFCPSFPVPKPKPVAVCAGNVGWAEARGTCGAAGAFPSHSASRAPGAGPGRAAWGRTRPGQVRGRNAWLGARPAARERSPSSLNADAPRALPVPEESCPEREGATPLSAEAPLSADPAPAGTAAQLRFLPPSPPSSPAGPRRRSGSGAVSRHFPQRGAGAAARPGSSSGSRGGRCPRLGARAAPRPRPAALTARPSRGSAAQAPPGAFAQGCFSRRQRGPRWLQELKAEPLLSLDCYIFRFYHTRWGRGEAQDAGWSPAAAGAERGGRRRRERLCQRLRSARRRLGRSLAPFLRRGHPP